MDTAIVVKSDGQLERDVGRELEWDSRVDADYITLEVDQGVVTLTGIAPTYAQRIAAQAAAHRVVGVLDVVNDLKIQLPAHLTRSDTQIAQAVRHTLEWDVVVPDQDIRSTVSSGWVTLEGGVGSWHEYDAVERAVRHLTGVLGVRNMLQVDTLEVAGDAVRDEIEQALERRAERRAKHIRVEVLNGNIVKLTGTVHSWSEHAAVVGAARHTPGVNGVEDFLSWDGGL
jgi:osmotically-inducible protein OsmY